jgi:hypothetical protein
MDRDDADGAVAALEYFYAVQQYMFLTGSTAEYKELSHRACGYCDSMLGNARWLKESGATYTGGEKSIEVLEVYVRDVVTGVTPLDVRLTSEPVTILDAEGNEIDSVPRDVVDVRAELGQRDGQWVVVGLPPVPEAE